MAANFPPELDHLVYGGPDLLATVAHVAELTGLQAVPGGRHVGEGTANYLIALGGAAYLEIIGPDPLVQAPPGPRWFGLDDLDRPRLLTWALRPDDLDAAVVTAAAAGYDPGPVRAMSRRTDDGTDLFWRLTPDTVGRSGGGVPFLIDWGATAHPSSRTLPRVDLLALEAHHPFPHELAPALAALQVDLDVREGAAGLRARLSGPRGEVELS